MLFVTATDVRAPEFEHIKEDETERQTPASFHEACIERVEPHLGETLVRRSKAKYSTPDDRIMVTCHVSKYYDKPSSQYWFAFHPHQSDYLKQGEDAYVVFGCGSYKNVLVIPYYEFEQILNPETINITERDEGFYYHIHISSNENGFWLLRKRGFDPIKISKYLI